MFKKLAASLVTASTLLAGGATVAVIQNASAAPYEYKCANQSGSFVLDDDSRTGTAKGTYAGSITITDIQLIGIGETGNVDSAYYLTVNTRSGEVVKFRMEALAVNWTASGFHGGGILERLNLTSSEPSTPST